MSLRISRRACAAGNDAHDHLAEAMVVGTAIVPFRHRGRERPGAAAARAAPISGRTP